MEQTELAKTYVGVATALISIFECVFRGAKKKCPIVDFVACAAMLRRMHFLIQDAAARATHLHYIMFLDP